MGENPTPEDFPRISMKENRGTKNVKWLMLSFSTPAYFSIPKAAQQTALHGQLLELQTCTICHQLRELQTCTICQLLELQTCTICHQLLELQTCTICQLLLELQTCTIDRKSVV